MQYPKRRIALAVLLVVLAGVLIAGTVLLLHRDHAEKPDDGPEAAETAVPKEDEPAPDAEGVTDLQFEKQSASAIRLTWTARGDAAGYRVLRRTASGSWAQLAEVSAGETAYTDALDGTEPQQYLYRVDVLTPDGAAAPGAPIPASNISVCLDPGHYLNSSVLEGEEMYGYGEGLFTLRLGLELRDVLVREYGISVVMTRETDDITLGGYTNGELDNAHLSLRGEFAEGHDLFVSLHTNANLDDANGYPTCNQPLAINKTLVFVNQVALASDVSMAQANAVGRRLSELNFALGLSTSAAFTEGVPGSLIEWSDAFNDSLDTPGTVCYREGDEQKDYYGVLRGAASVGVPGLIVEHAFHTVAAVRQAAMQGDLAHRWAEADAAGFAEGWGFQNLGAS